MSNSRLIPRCAGWQQDLPLPHELPILLPSLGFDTPNHQDGVFLDLSRAPALARGWWIWLALIEGMATAVMLWLYLFDERTLKFEEWIILLGCGFVGVWSVSCCLKIELAPPRDLPLRFNRARQRIYAYNFTYRWWNPFERWRVTPVAYDWSQVRAERWLQRGATTHGVIIKGGVVLSIVKPGTNEVIDRFPLTTMGADAHAWAYICTYMQQGPDALPPPGPPKDHNDVSWCNIALLLAPKVKWPADMDRESRSAP